MDIKEEVDQIKDEWIVRKIYVSEKGVNTEITDRGEWKRERCCSDHHMNYKDIEILN